MLEWICRISSLVKFPTRGIENIKNYSFSVAAGFATPLLTFCASLSLLILAKIDKGGFGTRPYAGS